MSDNDPITQQTEEPLIDTLDLFILIFAAVTSGLYFYRNSIFGTNKPIVPPPPVSASNGLGPKPSTVKKKSKNFVKRMNELGKNVVLFYGSQTGTAEDYASRLAKEGTQRFGLKTMTVDVEDCDMSLLDQFPEDCLAFFVMATYGEGEPTDDAVEFWDLITSAMPEFSLSGSIEDRPLQSLRYVVFGLGNKTYEHFNAVARTVDAKLSDFGAIKIGVRGEGDDDASLEEDFLGWKEDMWKAVCDVLNIDQNEVRSAARIPAYKIMEIVDVDTDKVFYGELSDNALMSSGTQVYDAKNPYPSPIVLTRELMKATDRNCMHIELDISNSGITYQAGDHVAIWPINPERDVYRILRVLGLWEKRDTVVMIESTDPSATKKHPFPVPTTYATIFRNYLDIHAPVSRQFIGTLADYAPSEEAMVKLTTLGEDKEEYRKHVTDTHLTLGELLEEISPSGKPLDMIPLDLVIETLPRLQCRYYSISSTPKDAPNTIHITASVTTFVPAAAPQKTVYGLATNYMLQVHHKLENLPHPETSPYYLYSGPRNRYHDKSTNTIKMALHVRHTNFKLPKDLKTPVIMVGPGTGLAPFRGFLIERARYKEEGAEVGSTVLFFGCRKRSEDFLYSDELSKLFSILGESGRLFTAFSREQEHKVYVQHRLLENKQYLWDLLYNQSAYFYVCGDAKNMARDVNNCLVHIAQMCGGMDDANAANFVKDLRSHGKYQEDVWS